MLFAPEGIRLGRIVLPEPMVCEHLMVCGSPGAGKSVLLRNLLIQIQERRERAIVIDPESEYLCEFYRPERGDVVLNPLDSRMDFWSPWSELREEWFSVDAAAMAASIIRGRPRDENQRFFLDSTRTVIEAILHIVEDHSDASALLKLVSLPRSELHQALKGTAAYALVDPQAHDQGAGILSTAVNAIKTFGHLPKQHETRRTWSARQWVQGRQPGWIFLPSREDLDETIRVLRGLWVDVLVRWLMTEEINIGGDQTWVIADELAALGHQPQIEKLMVRGRKRGIAAVLGLQNIAQLKAIYGAENCTALTSAAGTKIVLRVDETESCKWASSLIGEHEIERVTITSLAGLSTYREGLNLSPQRLVTPLVMPDEIKLLRPFNGYICIAGHNRAPIRIPKLYLTRRHPAFIPRPAGAAVTVEAVPVEEPTEDQIVEQLKQRAQLPQPPEM
jgi:type IV secretory pathway TraG/TraD family ATPase VirD4